MENIYKQQKIAFENPCFLAEETTNNKFRFLIDVTAKNKIITVGVILTLNIGLEWAKFFHNRALWHTSISIPNINLIPKNLILWNKQDYRIAEGIALKVLDNIGDMTTKNIEFGNIAFHHRRALTQKEESQLANNPKYIARGVKDGTSLY